MRRKDFISAFPAVSRALLRGPWGDAGRRGAIWTTADPTILFHRLVSLRRLHSTERFQCLKPERKEGIVRNHRYNECKTLNIMPLVLIHHSAFPVLFCLLKSLFHSLKSFSSRGFFFFLIKKIPSWIEMSH